MSGNLGAVTLQGSGVTNFYLQGQANSVNLDLSGVSQAASAISSGIVRFWRCTYAICTLAYLCTLKIRFLKLVLGLICLSLLIL